MLIMYLLNLDCKYLIFMFMRVHFSLFKYIKDSDTVYFTGMPTIRFLTKFIHVCYFKVPRCLNFTAQAFTLLVQNTIYFLTICI